VRTTKRSCAGLSCLSDRQRRRSRSSSIRVDRHGVGRPLSLLKLSSLPFPRAISQYHDNPASQDLELDPGFPLTHQLRRPSRLADARKKIRRLLHSSPAPLVPCMLDWPCAPSSRQASKGSGVAPRTASGVAPRAWLRPSDATDCLLSHRRHGRPSRDIDLTFAAGEGAQKDGGSSSHTGARLLPVGAPRRMYVSAMLT
jgi:hypothetical protein